MSGQKWRHTKDMFTIMKENFSWKVEDITKLHPENYTNFNYDRKSRKRYRIYQIKNGLRISLMLLIVTFVIYVLIDIIESLRM